MNKSTRNYWYWNILFHYEFDLEKRFFDLDSIEASIVRDLADAVRCEGEDGKSPARTLWDRAKEGRPF